MRSAHRQLLRFQPCTIANSSHKRWATTSSLPSTLTVLHKASTLLPRVLPSETARAYELLFEDSREALTKKPNVARVSFHAVDQWAKDDARNIVTAMLYEPFASDNSSNEDIKTRAVDGIISTGHSYLTQFSVPIEITEHRESNPQMADTLKSDISFLVSNPLTTNTNSVSTPYGTTLVLSTPTLSTSLESHLKAQLPVDGNDVIFVDPQQAIRALQYLPSGSSPLSSSTIQSYQTDFVGSRVSKLTTHIQTVLSDPSSSLSPVERLHARTALTRLRSSIIACDDALRSARDQIDQLLDQVADLRSTFERLKALEMTKIIPEGSVKTDMGMSRNEVARTFASLSLWRLAGLGRVDEVSDAVGGVVRRGWCRGLEDQLILHSGRLEAERETLTSSALSTASSVPSFLHSSVLLNKLLQVQQQTHGPSSLRTPTTSAGTELLTRPIYTRRSQLIMYTIPQLHLAAQRAVLTVYGGITSGALTAGWWTYSSVLPLADHGALSLLSFNALPPSTLPTSFALGLALSLTGVRLAQSIWKRAQGRFWADWGRIADGLERDLNGNADKMLTNRVGGVARAACDGLEEIARERKEGVKELEIAVDTVRSEVEHIKRT